MPDGTCLAARLWVPQGEPCPAILEFIPYRRRDMVRPRDERNHPYFASHGYACLRVDMRGSGDSEGVMTDMYEQSELDDARHVISWIAAQPWSSGRVGMFGTSWGGTASLQAAVDAPDPLKAVIANCATIDRFEDDIHWMGGCLLTDSIEWGATLPAILAAPPDSATVGAGWMEMWRSRLEHISFPFENWARHTRRGRYWRHGSVRFDADRLSCPILAIGGWSDRYSNSVMRLVRTRPDLCWGIVGPWGHHYPDHGEPGPAVSFQDIALEWWDHWLRPEVPAPPEWPDLRLWNRDFDPPQDRLPRRNGSWVAVDEPSEAVADMFVLGAGTLSMSGARESAILEVPFDTRHGECAGDTGYFGRVGGLPLDQSPDDARALCFDSGPLAEDVSLLGHAVLSLEVETDRLPSQIVCRICDVAPDGRSTLVTRTVRALELDDMLDGIGSVLPGQPGDCRITFPAMAYRFRAGHRIRLAIGTSYWPLVWPTGQRANLTVHTAAATLALPRLPDGASVQAAPFPQPTDLPQTKPWKVRSDGKLQRMQATQKEGSICSGWHQPLTTVRFEKMDLDFSWETEARHCLPHNDPAGAHCMVRHRIGVRRHDGEATIVSRLHVRAEGDGYVATSELTTYWNGEEIHKIVFTTGSSG